MPDTTLGITYPAQNAPNDLAYHFQVLSEDVDTLIDGAWITPAPNTGWAQWAGVRPLRYRKVGNTVQVQGTMLYRTTSAATSPGAGIAVFTFPADVRPSLNVIIGTGSIGVGGSLGANISQLGTDGNLAAISLVAGGTMQATQNVQNHVTIPSGTYGLV